MTSSTTKVSKVSKTDELKEKTELDIKLAILSGLISIAVSQLQLVY